MKIETHDAIVTSNDDPEKRCRIMVACAGLLGDEEAELPMFVEPIFDWGWFIVPDVGEIVEIEVNVGGDDDEIFGQTSIDAPNVRWKGKRRWTAEETDGENEARPIHEDFATNYGKRRGFATPNGHIMYFDDTEGKQKVHISWKQDDKYQFISMDETGSMSLANKNGTMIYMDAENKAFTIIDENSNLISMDEDGVKLIDKFSNIIELKDGAIQILGQKAITIMGGVCDIKSATVNILDGAVEPVVKGLQLKTYIETHTHPTGTGPSGVPIVPLPPTALSQNAKVGD